MKKNRMSFEALSEKFKQADSKSNQNKDDRQFYPKIDESGNGQAVIRFLPPKDGESSPWVRVYSHGFKESGGWYIENCPTTIGNDCPCCLKNGALWSTGIDSDKEIARKRKRRLQYITNVLVVSDKKNPEREGKVMLFKFGAKIFDKIKSALYPEFDDEQALNPFDFWDGANFNLRIRKVQGMVNYDKSDFAAPSPIAKTDKAIEEIWKQEHSLEEFIAPDQFKSEEELSKRLARVLNDGTRSAAPQTTAASPMASEASSAPVAAPTSEPVSESTESAMDFFRKMAED